jgi:membrane protein YqaA with SNARE-associated domain
LSLYTVKKLRKAANLLKRFSQWMLVMGIPGLFALSFIDSAIAPLVGGPDLLLCGLAVNTPSMTFYYVLAASVGSALGCLIPYGIGLKGGKKALSRFKPETIARVEGYMHRWGAWTIVAGALAPPPFPTKVVVLAAGVLRTPRSRLLLSILAGRMVRYSIMGYLAAFFGKNAMHLFKSYYPVISLAIIGLIVLIAIIRTVRTERTA